MADDERGKYLYYNRFPPILRLAEKTPLPGAQGRKTRLRRR